MTRKMVGILLVGFIVMVLCSPLAYAEQEAKPTELAAVEAVNKEAPEQKTTDPEMVMQDKEVPQNETPAPEAETPDQDETPNESTAPEAGTPVEDETQAEMPAPDAGMPNQVRTFEGKISVDILNKGKVAYGDRVTLVAAIEDAADIIYSLRWEVNDGSGWKTIEGERDRTYTFTLTEENADYQWRVTVTYTLLETLEQLDVPLGVEPLEYGALFGFSAVAGNVCVCFE